MTTVNTLLTYRRADEELVEKMPLDVTIQEGDSEGLAVLEALLDHLDPHHDPLRPQGKTLTQLALAVGFTRLAYQIGDTTHSVIS